MWDILPVMSTNQTKLAEIVRLQDIVAAATAKLDIRDTRPPAPYIALVDEYLAFLLHFVGNPNFEWSPDRIAEMHKMCETTTNIRSLEVLETIPEDMIPPVVVREMLLGDKDGPWMHVVVSARINEFMTKYPFILSRNA